MRRSESFVMKRREDIVRLLEERGRMDVTDLAERFGVSPLTIRRDLDYLESRQLVSHQYGSATLVNTLGRPSGSRRVMAKRAIARRAAGFVEDGDAVFVNASSTALDVVNHIEAEDVSVITNNSKVMLLQGPLKPTVLLTGGEAVPPRASLTGQLALDTIGRFTATKCFIGCSGISARVGLTSNTAPEPTVDALMLARSRAHFVLLDSDKIGVECTYAFGTAADAGTVITDDGATDEQVEELLSAGVREVIRVPLELGQEG
ncbi:DeoR/GlpR family DNA-binding transcription regulator [Olsenella porci]|uniref:DeoR/GlpR transcriptional regulator n=1 Tax=Olsenella porci TaxID=2652279 RepID=A0A6N7XQZ9_9ACTN|nr:DeoR/GlpR family DNA-binding transcription regulator [Olsenella porci]MST71891.1 DeoR/GlpR transcriptional regulator [Olsenella porci]